MDCLLVGAGSVAEAYADGLAASTALRVTGVCDLHPERADALAAAHPSGPAVYTDLADALAADPAPMVINLTSHAAHADVTEACLAAGRHVFSEKPLAMDAARAADLVAAAERHDLGLGCAPITPGCDAQRHARALAADGRLGGVQFAAATANVGRVDEWHDRPASFLDVGPLYDGAVYPLALLVAWFGRVTEVRTADAVAAWPPAQRDGDDAPDGLPHVEATLSFSDGPVVSLRASFYVDHRSREFYGLELHGDDGTLYLRDTGALGAPRDAVTVRGGDREPTLAPQPQPRCSRAYAAGPERLADRVAGGCGSSARASARRGAHVVAVCNAIERAATDGGPVAIPEPGVSLARPGQRRPAPVAAAPSGFQPGGRALRLPPVGFGCSRYRDGTYVTPAMGAAVDAGYRLFDTAELYGNEWRLGDLVAAPGGPDRESVFLVGKPWRTNHGPGDLREACTGSLDELGVAAFDCYALHWPGAWAHRGTLTRLSERPVEEQERLTMPTAADGTPARAPHSLVDTWRRMEALHDDGLARSLGVCNVTLPQLAGLTDAARVRPALVQVECHPYRPRDALVSWCHRHGVRVVAHSPLSAPGLLDEPVVHAVADEHGVSPATAVLAWHCTRGVVPIPSTTTREHVVANLAAPRHPLTDDQRDRMAGLADPAFQR
ncbi:MULTISPECIES: aldo/keto reductase [Halobacterium]|nr:aldo/keto reductase [Halobacterium sp. GSL-19]QRY23468.1 aldo/keto reductase [Halobacterium sp. GSL-19]